MPEDIEELKRLLALVQDEYTGGHLLPRLRQWADTANKQKRAERTTAQDWLARNWHPPAWVTHSTRRRIAPPTETDGFDRWLEWLNSVNNVIRGVARRPDGRVVEDTLRGYLFTKIVTGGDNRATRSERDQILSVFARVLQDPARTIADLIPRRVPATAYHLLPYDGVRPPSRDDVLDYLAQHGVPDAVIRDIWGPWAVEHRRSSRAGQGPEQAGPPPSEDEDDGPDAAQPGAAPDDDQDMAPPEPTIAPPTAPEEPPTDGDHPMPAAAPATTTTPGSDSAAPGKSMEVDEDTSAASKD